MPSGKNYLRYIENPKSSDKRIHSLSQETIAIIKQLLTVSPKNIIAFSGGKESIVIAHFATKLGINNSISEVSFLFEKSKQEMKQIGEYFGLNMTFKEGLTWEWLAKNQQFCSPNLKLQSQLYSIRQQKTVKSFAKKHQFTGVIYGRRIEENTVPSALYQLKDKQWQCHPLRNWLLDDIWYFIRENNLPYPSLYHHEIGIKEGFEPFLLPPEHFENVWKTIYNYEPEAIRKMAKIHKPARDYLVSLGELK